MNSAPPPTTSVKEWTPRRARADPTGAPQPPTTKASKVAARAAYADGDDQHSRDERRRGALTGGERST
ncbi:hypothetical protein [Streptomyces sp. NPDC126522]|uniref:hypothetical protein n=1 Tax=Streptomyces sp. NPDC126522 TaxID=3155211 RepID=UPI003333F9BC